MATQLEINRIREEIIALLYDSDEPLRINKIAKRVNCSYQQAYQQLTSLWKDKKIHKTADYPAGYYMKREKTEELIKQNKNDRICTDIIYCRNGVGRHAEHIRVWNNSPFTASHIKCSCGMKVVVSPHDAEKQLEEGRLQLDKGQVSW